MKNNARVFRARKFSARILATLLLATTFLGGCSKNTSDSTSSATGAVSSVSSAGASATGASVADSAAASSDAGEGFTIPPLPTKDLSGNEITVPEEVNAIISMNPSTTQLLIDLGLGDKIVATDTYSATDFAASLKSDVKSFDMMTPDNEQLIALKPDLVFTTDMSGVDGNDDYAAVREAGIAVLDIPSASSLQEIVDSILFVGNCTGTYKEAYDISKRMEAFMYDLDAIGKTVKEEEKVKVLFTLSTPSADYPQIYSVGKGSYIDEILTKLGAVNIAGSEDTPWPVLTEEATVEANPDFVLLADNYTPDAVNTLLGLKGWENITAVANKQVYLIDANAISRPNQHVCGAIAEIAHILYPGIYKDIMDPFAK